MKVQDSRARESKATGPEGRPSRSRSYGLQISLILEAKAKPKRKCGARQHEAVTSERVSSGSRVLGEAGWKYPPLERAKDTQLLRAKPKGKGKRWEMKRGIPMRSMVSW